MKGNDIDYNENRLSAAKVDKKNHEKYWLLNDLLLI